MSPPSSRPSRRPRRSERRWRPASLIFGAVQRVEADTIDAFIPIPLQPWKTQLSMLGALLAFRRPRQHLGRGVRSLTRLDGKELGASVLRSVGLLHSSGDPVEVMRGAASAARKRGDEAQALKIEEAIAAIQALPGGVA